MKVDDRKWHLELTAREIQRIIALNKQVIRRIESDIKTVEDARMFGEDATKSQARKLRNKLKLISESQRQLKRALRFA